MRKLLLILLTTFFVSNCSLITPVVLHIPEDPVLRDCPAKPSIEGRRTADGVLLDYSDAIELRDYINDLQKCREANEVILKGHIEKLKNRLRAVGGQ